MTNLLVVNGAAGTTKIVRSRAEEARLWINALHD
jgi:hypothetical protein